MVNADVSLRESVGRKPLWIIALTVGLLSLGFGATRDVGDRVEAGSRRGNERRVGPGDGRGRSAATPSDIPWKGWKDILWRVYGKISSDRTVLIAAGITFYSILSLFPAIAALVAIYGMFTDPATMTSHLQSLTGVLPEGGIQVVRDQISRVAAQGNSNLTIAFVAGLAISIWSANAAMKSIFDALNLVYQEDEKRGLVLLNAVSLAFTVSAILFLLVSLAAIVVLPAIFKYVGLDQAGQILSFLRWPLLLLGVMLALAILYRYGPSREKAHWRWITWGSAFAAVVWLAASILFSWYAANFGSYNKTYGALGAIIGFMVWIWISAIVVLVGAEIDAKMEHQTGRDTTTGRSKPLGSRGARMADTVGAAQN